jgi:hypothetical protein
MILHSITISIDYTTTSVVYSYSTVYSTDVTSYTNTITETETSVITIWSAETAAVVDTVRWCDHVEEVAANPGY